MGDLEIKVTISGDSKSLEQATKRVNAAFKNMISPSAVNASAASIDKLSSKLSNMGSLVVKAFAAKQIFDFGKGLTFLEAGIQSTQSLLKTVTGSTEAASKQFDLLLAQSNQLGGDFLTASQQFAFFAAAAKEAGLSMADTNAVFFNFQTALSGLQVSGEVASRVFTALTQMASNPKVALEELKTQLGEALPGVISKAARAIGTDVTDLLNRISRGELVSAEFIKAFSTVLATDFPAVTNGAQQSINRLENSWVVAKKQFAESGFIDGVTTGMDRLTAAINANQPKLKAWGETLGGAIQYLLDNGPQASALLGALAGARFGVPGALAGGALGFSIGSDLSKNVDTEIAAVRKKIAVMETEGLAGKLIDVVAGQSISAERTKLDLLIAEKERLQRETKAIPPQQTQVTDFKFDPTKGFTDSKSNSAALKEEKDLQREAAQVIADTRTPMEELNIKQAEYKKLLDSSAISLDTYSRAMQKAIADAQGLSEAVTGLSTAEEFRLKSEADSAQIRAEQAKLDAQNPYKTKTIVDSSGNIAQVPTHIGNENIQQDIQTQINDPAKPVKIDLSVNQEFLNQSVYAAIAEAQKNVQTIQIPVAYTRADQTSSIDAAALSGGIR